MKSGDVYKAVYYETPLHVILIKYKGHDVWWCKFIYSGSYGCSCESYEFGYKFSQSHLYVKVGVVDPFDKNYYKHFTSLIDGVLVG